MGRTHIIHLETSAQQPGLGIADGHPQPLAEGSLIGSVLGPSITFESVEQLILFLRGQPSDTLWGIGDKGSEDNSQADSHDTLA